jgi:hypothetical protein
MSILARGNPSLGISDHLVQKFTGRIKTGFLERLEKEGPNCLRPEKTVFLKSRSLGLSKRLGYSDEHDISNCESKIVEAEKVLGALLRSMRR